MKFGVFIGLIAIGSMAFVGGSYYDPANAASLAPCSSKKNEYKKDKIKYGQKNGKFHYAYANGKGKTLTGVQGCGWSGKQNSASQANSIALANCRKHNTNDTCKVTIYFRWSPKN